METDDAFPIGRLVEPNEYLMASVIRHCRHLVNLLVQPNNRLYLAKVLNCFMNHEAIKISMYYVIDILSFDFKWRARHHTPVLVVKVADNINEVVATLEGFPGPLPPVEIPSNFTT